MAHLSRITIYPIKSLDGVDLPEATVLPSGALENDRRFALADEDGQLVFGKRTAMVHTIRSTFDLTSWTVTLGRQGENRPQTYSLDKDRASVESWFSQHFEVPITLVENRISGFPDDTDRPGPTVLSTATLEEVAGWFPGIPFDETRQRFRANIEIGGVEAFWEDKLFAAPGQAVRFRVGDLVLDGTNPCPRCVVPSRSPTSGEALRGYQARFSDRRRETLPPWAPLSRFDHTYQLAVNTRPTGQAATVVRVGDNVEIVDLIPAT